MVNLLFIDDDPALSKPGVVQDDARPGVRHRRHAQRRRGPPAIAEPAGPPGYGQELNPETYAVCRSDMMLKGQDASRIVLGNSFAEDGFPGGRYDYLLANPRDQSA